MLVDSQMHVWGAHTEARPWPTEVRHIAHRARPPDTSEVVAVLDAAGVDRAVLVPPSWEGDRNDVALAAARAHPERLAVMGRVPLTDPDNAQRLPGWRDSPNMLGLRVTLHREPLRGAFLDGATEWFWAAAADARLPVMVYPPGLVREIGRVAARYPGLRIAVDHLAAPVDKNGAEAYAELPSLLALARLPNVAVKASAQPCHSRQPYPFTDVHEPLQRVIDAFGPHRVFWGSDWTRLPCSYADNLRFFEAALVGLSSEEIALTLGSALLRWLDWP
ncbi:amidohydrolase family protein [Micromonospora tarapacensis]|uniref:amidohydrolase family protein n=1 Tax=Micromonospora tarapacensis TaxID=2835305 RepID=UPI001E50A8AC|nr:amidohydrolase family protein [Micromonospora tarapacensis]